MEAINKETFSAWLSEFLKQEEILPWQFAEAVGCSKSTTYRLIDGCTFPSAQMINQAKIMDVSRFSQYSKFSNAQKKKILERACGTGGGAVGVAGIAFAINTMGVAGLSAAGIASGLAAIGGTMMGGVMVATVAPAVIGAMSFAGACGLKQFRKNQQLNAVDIDTVWEEIYR